VRSEPKIDRYLLPTEQRVFAVRRHWAALSSTIALYGTFIVGGLFAMWAFSGTGLAETVAIFFVIFTLIWLAWLIGDWYVERFVVTNRRVLLITGLLNRKVAIMPLIKVTDLTFEQSVWGRMLHFGTFIIESAGQDQALSRIDYLAHPLQRYREVSALLFGTNVAPDPEDVPSRNDTAPIPTVRPRRRH
jgi:uncharacterized membrane protein YdbT with pleckstrin-like domain